MQRKVVGFEQGNKAGEVAYVVDSENKIVYFTQISGNYTSINGAEDIVESIAHKEEINWLKYRWVDIQTRSNCQDELIFHQPKSLWVASWEHFDVPDEIFKALS